jgi:hypothetical protein
MDLCNGQTPEGIAAQLASGSTPNAEALGVSVRLSSAVESWQSQVSSKLNSIVDLSTSTGDLARLGEWAAATSQTLTRMGVICSAVERACGCPTSVRQALKLFNIVAATREIGAALDSSSESDSARLGSSYRGLETDFAKLRNDLAWARNVLAVAGEPMAESTAEAIMQQAPVAEELNQRTGRVTKAWFAIADLFEQPWRDQLTDDFMVSLGDGGALLAELQQSIGDIDEWCRFAAAKAELVDAGLAPVVQFVEERRTDAVDVGKIFERSILERWTDAIVAEDERLSILAPRERDSLVAEFRELDRALVANANARVINQCASRRPATTLGAAGIIRREAQKKTRHKPIRMLLDETREVALALKPCFMMSPLSVSQFLPADIDFDVVIFDEASQVRPADAMNCIYRGRQLIVAGDPRQLPPTNFFEHATEDTGDDFDDEAPEDFESILDVYVGSGLPPLSLKWHYRSQHESLITYSNYKFYRGQLHTFPGAIEKAADVGVELIFAGGVYRRGGARDNPVEASKVVERVLFHRRNHPELTLGVVAFSAAQESAIVAEIERQTPTVPELARLDTADRLNGFFVKNLENVQGDERDIIIFSVGYGPDEHGKFTEQLGPLGKKGGERRLNVAITRARRRVEVVSSVRSGDFPGTSAAEGIRHLQRYLDFAERGPVALAIDIDTKGGDAESPFEEEVLAFLGSLGVDAVPQVGVAGYRIDIGVRHPGRPGEFVIGIECDGAAYHSSRVARDRDRLRQEILEALGWRIYRIWGTSWFRDRSAQEMALRDAIRDAVSGVSAAPQTKQPVISVPTVQLDEIDLDEAPGWTIPYQVHTWRLTQWYGEPHEVPLPILVGGIEQIVAAEGPIHQELLLRRLAEVLHVGRIGSRIKSHLDAAVALAIRGKVVSRVEKVFLVAPESFIGVRVPGSDDRTNRVIGHVASIERQAAIRQLVRDSHRVGQDELRVAFGRIFGWRRIGADIEAAFEMDLRSLVKAGHLQRVGINLTVGESGAI